MVLLRRKFKVASAGPVQLFTGTRPRLGSVVEKDAREEQTALALLVANQGRSLKMESVLLSWPVVRLYGCPELMMTNGLSEKEYGREKFPPRKIR